MKNILLIKKLTNKIFLNMNVVLRYVKYFTFYEKLYEMENILLNEKITEQFFFNMNFVSTERGKVFSLMAIVHLQSLFWKRASRAI